jgi:hypothetical protein
LRGRIALDQFRQRVELRSTALRAEHADWSDDAVHEAVCAETDGHALCAEAVDNFLVAITFAQLLSPRSAALSVLYDTLYDEYLRYLNWHELSLFHDLVRGHDITRRKHAFRDRQRQQADRDNLELEDLGDLDEFLHESLGIGNRDEQDV